MHKLIEKFSKKIGNVSRLEAEILLEYHQKSGEALEAIFNKKSKGMPVCKIVGYKGFYKDEFMVDENVLSPRPDSETLVVEAVELLRDIKEARILELGVGSGCLILSILKDCLDACGVGVDISIDALNITKINAKNLNLENRLKTIRYSWFDESFPDELIAKFDIIISNPPYIASAEIQNLDIEVRNHDPLLALDGGIDGLRDYRQISKISKNILKKDGYILLEIGAGQSLEVENIFEKQGFTLIKRIKDLSSIERCLVFKNK